MPPRVPLQLGVNVDHVATLRQARRTPYPSPLEACRICAAAGAHGITVHLREDRRHIQDQDVLDALAGQPLPVNLEMSLAPDILAFAERTRPPEACLVPERRAELTTEGGLDVRGHFDAVREATRRLQASGVEVSLFIDPDPGQVEAAAHAGARVVELHTGAYAEATGQDRERPLRELIEGARRAHALGLRVNAGHGLTTGNLPALLRVPHLHTLNIGHSIVSRAVLIGLAEAVREMLAAMAPYTGGEPA
jgi:pyridoxine 5-phosphate synthase